MIVIYSPYQSARLSYVFDTLFSEWLATPYRLISDKVEFGNFDSKYKLWYHESAPSDASLWVHNSGFLADDEVRKCKVKVSGEGKDVLLFPGDGDFGFDVFAAIFYLISRYEEYHDTERDIHGRFPAKCSLAYRMGFLQYPIVDIWRKKFVETSILKWGDAPFQEPGFQFIASVDVDNATAFSNKGFFRGILGVFRSIFLVNKPVVRRVKSLFDARVDPYNTYDFQWRATQNIRYIHFVLCAAFSGHDRSLSPGNRYFQELIRKMDQNAEVAWHPSYAAFGNLEALRLEKMKLEAILGRPVIRSRQHYIRLKFPETYRQLFSLGIQEDYSMGYPEMPGFRAGTTMPFRFFDVAANRAQDFMIYSFPWLDTFYSEKQGVSAQKAFGLMTQLGDLVRTYGGVLVAVMHHRSFSEWEGRWRGWPGVFEDLIKRYR